jgi:hypothetical protein
MNDFIIFDDTYRKERAIASLAGTKITGCKLRLWSSYQGTVSKLLMGHWLNGLLTKGNLMTIELIVVCLMIFLDKIQHQMCLYLRVSSREHFHISFLLYL